MVCFDFFKARTKRDHFPLGKLSRTIDLGGYMLFHHRHRMGLRFIRWMASRSNGWELDMACQASFGITLFYLFVAFDTGRVGWFVRPRYHLLVNDVAVTVYTFELCLLNVHPVGYLNLLDDLLFLFLNILVTADAILIDECVPRGILMGKDLPRLRMTVDTSNLGWMNRLSPHLDSGLTLVAAEAYPRVGHQKMSRKNNNGHSDDEDPWKDTKKKPFLLDQVNDEPFQEVKDFHKSNSSSCFEITSRCR